jgi:hypothetical protein
VGPIATAIMARTKTGMNALEAIVGPIATAILATTIATTADSLIGNST